MLFKIFPIKELLTSKQLFRFIKKYLVEFFKRAVFWLSWHVDKLYYEAAVPGRLVVNYFLL